VLQWSRFASGEVRGGQRRVLTGGRLNKTVFYFILLLFRKWVG
jgi:hypothetical protein